MERLRRVNQTLEKEIGILEVQSQIQNKRQGGDVQDPARLLPARAAAPDPQRAGRRRRPRRGDGGAARQGPARRACPTRRRAEADKQMRRLDQMHAESAEAVGAARRTSTWLVELPWKDTPARTCSTSTRRADPRRGPLRSRAHQGSHPRLPGGAQAARRARTVPSSVSWGRPASARPRSGVRSPARWGASSCASRWAACATRPRSAATAAPTSARCPAGSSRG